MSWLGEVPGLSPGLWEPCYRERVTGFQAGKFHTACGGKVNTVTLVRLNTFVFGGYHDRDWSGKARGYGLYCSLLL